MAGKVEDGDRNVDLGESSLHSPQEETEQKFIYINRKSPFTFPLLFSEHNYWDHCNNLILASSGSRWVASSGRKKVKLNSSRNCVVMKMKIGRGDSIPVPIMRTSPGIPQFMDSLIITFPRFPGTLFGSSSSSFNLPSSSRSFSPAWSFLHIQLPRPGLGLGSITIHTYLLESLRWPFRRNS